MAEGASIGSVYVDVLPSSEGFFARFQGQTQAQAARVGQELGGQIGKQISDSIVKGIRDGLGEGTKGSPGKAPGRRTGDDFAGEFERTVQTRIAAALRALPKAKIDADSADADRKVQELRARLTELSSKRIGVDISDADAVAEIRRLQEELARLARESPSIRVTADAVRAAAELEAVRREAERLAGLNPNIRIDTNASEAASELLTVDQAASTSSGGMRNLYAAGIALGPGIIPVAAAVAAAVAGIGSGALGAAAGLGVVLLGTRGIGDAVKAMGAADDSAAKDVAQLASRQTQLASASDSVASAQRGLANAQANAADATRRAAETVRNAQVSLTQAEQQALRAEQDLTRAREDARRAMQDLATQVADGALAQRQAQIDLTKAEQELQAVRANPAASQLQREQAQLTYDQAVQQITDLGIRQQRAQTDLANSQKAGIDGSQQVVAAQDRVAQSQEAVRKAVQSLADARVAEATTARQNAFAIAQAAQGVESAQRSLAAATVAAGTAGGAAMDTLRQKMANLSPEGQAFAAFLYNLKPVWLDLTSAAQGGFLPGAREGIEALLPVMPQIIGDVGTLSRTVGDLSAEAGRTFAAPYWQSFFHFLAGEANVALVVFTHSAENAAVGVSGLARAFIPLGQDVGGGLLRFSERFAYWGVTLEHNQGFQSVLGYIRTEGPIVADTLGRVAVAAFDIVQAAQPIGGVVLTGLRLVSAVISGIPTPILTVLVGGIVAVVTATKAWNAIQTVMAASAPARIALQLLWNQTVQGANAAMAGAGPQASGFGRALAGISGGARAAAGGVGGLLGMIGPGGLWGIGITAAVIGIGLFSNAVSTSKQRTDQLANALHALGEAYGKTHSLADQSSKDIIKQSNDLSGLILHTDRYGLSVQDVLNATQGVPGSLNAIDEAQHRLLISQGGLTQEQRRGFDALRQAYHQAQDNATVDQVLAGAQDKVASSAFRQTEAQHALGTALNVVANASSTAAQKADALKQADDAVFGAVRNADQAAEDFAAAQDRLTQSVKQGTHEIGINTQAGRDNYDAVKASLKAADDQYFAMIRNGATVEEATKKFNDNIASIRQQAHDLGLDAGAVQNLVDKFGTLPTDPKVQLQVSGVQEALDQLKNLEIAQIALRQGVDVNTATRIWREQNPHPNQGGHATGGPVFGAGTETSDSIPAWLSHNEHVWTAAEVKAAGGHAVVEMLRSAVLGGALRPPKTRYPGDGSGGIAFAKGGAVTWPFPVNISNLWKPTAAELRSAALYGPSFTGPVSGNIASIQSWIRAQAGKPYIWAAAGPQGYDCSGATSAVWNLAHGRGAYSHTFSTMNEAPYFPLGGFGGVMTAGWTNPGERGPGGNSVGHTAAVFAGLPFESRGGDGFVVGSRVTPVSSFAHVGHFDDGGVLPPGITIARNDTGRLETIRNAEQEAALQSALAGGSGRAGTDRNLVHIENYHAATDPWAVAADLDWRSRGHG